MKKIKEIFKNWREKLKSKKFSLDFLQRFKLFSRQKISMEDQKKEVLKRARRFVYPWKMPKHKSAFISTIIIIVLLLTFLTGVGTAIYKYKSESELVYQVSRIVPFPLGKVGTDYVQYEDYLFELRSLKHVYGEGAQSFGREPVSFESNEGREVLQRIQKEALEKAQQNALIQQLARKHNVTVSRAEVEARIDEQIERYGGEDRLQDILDQSFGWSERMAIANLRRSYETSILKLKLAPILDEENRKKANKLLERVNNNPNNFKQIAKQESEDGASRQDGGDLGFMTVDELATQSKAFAEAAAQLETGEISDVVTSDVGFHIIKKLEERDDEIKVAHIQINYFDIDKYLDERLAETESVIYGELKELANSAAVLHY